MTSQGHPHARFQHALARGNATLALAAAADLPQLSLEDALGLTLLLADREPARYGRAAAQWHARFIRERGRGLEVEQSSLLLAVLAALPRRPAATGATLERLLSELGEEALASVARRWQVERQLAR